MKLMKIIVIFVLIVFLIVGCKSTDKAKDGTVAGADKVLGFGILSRLPGQWHGPVHTTTPAGSFENWYVDFRPVSAGQVSQYSTMNQDVLNYLSFFIVKHEGQLKVAIRTEGVFQNKGCITYEVIDKVNDKKGYYRFSDFQAGEARAYTEFFFTGDGFTMDTYTNKSNTVSPLQLHSRWKATAGDKKAAQAAIKRFNFPQPVMVKDFSNVFSHMSESIFFQFDNDPYPSDNQPYVGTVTVNIGIDKSLKVKPTHELFVLLTTDSLFSGLKYDPTHLKYISRFVFLPPETKSFTFKNIHPGKYFVYTYNDINGDKHHKSGDWMSSDLNNVITVPEEGSVTVDSVIDFVIP